ncbi:MAG TPA: Lrp/AsnC family transcriptional regulator [Alphaproteobacteria bacterium]|nr:Lrp/AsnC family transcriptional regulator [Alphaproteobacteria bacterium]
MPEGQPTQTIASLPEAAADALERRIVDLYQHGFPLDPRPFAVIGERLGVSEADVIAAVKRLKARGALGRIGAVIPPNRVGASTLAAMTVPPDRLEAVAGLVSRHQAVNHNYEREHAFNLWFVVTAPNPAAVETALREINAATGLEVLDLPLEEAYHIDLGFKVRWSD